MPAWASHSRVYIRTRRQLVHALLQLGLTVSEIGAAQRKDVQRRAGDTWAIVTTDWEYPAPATLMKSILAWGAANRELPDDAPLLPKRPGRMEALPYQTLWRDARDAPEGAPEEAPEGAHAAGHQR